MGIFDNISEEEMQQMLAMGQDQGLGMGGGKPTMWEPDYASMGQEQEPQAPEMPTAPNLFQPGDVSGFAGYGMEAPALPDPTQQTRGLMGNVIGANVASNWKPNDMRPKGGLMAYLSTLGV
jgi:hypothetical protein